MYINFSVTAKSILSNFAILPRISYDVEMTNVRSRVDEILKVEAEALLAIPKDNPYEKAIELIHACMKNKGYVVVSGVGKAGDVGQKISSTFNSSGINSLFLSPLNAKHGDLGVLRDTSILLVVSNSGKTNEILDLIALAKGLHPRIKTICITGHRSSPIAKASNVVLYTGGPLEVCPLGLTPTTSVLTMLAIADVITVLSMTKRKFTAHDYHARHHGGYLGSKAKKLKRKK